MVNFAKAAGSLISYACDFGELGRRNGTRISYFNQLNLTK